jgi:hypothetical protein
MKGFWQYCRAKKFVHGLSIASKTDWDKYLKRGLKPYYIPSTPDRTYLGKGWISWMEWLGYKKERVKGYDRQSLR